MTTRFPLIMVDGTIQEMPASDVFRAVNVPLMVGDSGAGGIAGAVPPPGVGDSGKGLSGAGTWVDFAPLASPSFTTSIATPSITTIAGALAITPAAGSGVNVNLSTTGDFAVNTNKFYIDTSTGYIGIGTATPVTPVHTVAIPITTAYTVGSGANVYPTTLLQINETTAPAASLHYADVVDYIFNPSTDVTSTRYVRGRYSTITIPASNSSNLSGVSLMSGFYYADNFSNVNVQGINGLSAQVRNSGTGTTALIAGSYVMHNIGTGTVSSGVCVKGNFANNSTTGTVTDFRYIDLSIFANLGTVTNTYGVYIGDITVGTQTNTPFSFYASDPNAYNYFAGNTGIGQLTFGTSATKTLSLGSGIAPTTSPADAVQLYSADQTAGNATLFVRTENGGIVKLFTGAALTAPLTTITHTAPGTPDYALQNLVQNSGFGFATADEGNTVLSVILNLQTRLNQVEARLQDAGLIS